MGIEVRYSTNRAPVSGNPKADCKGVKEAIGLPSSVDPFPPIALCMTSIPGDEGGLILVDFGVLPDPFSTSVSAFFVYKVSLIGGGLLVSCGIFLGLPFFCDSSSKPEGTISFSWERMIYSPCSTWGRRLRKCF